MTRPDAPPLPSRRGVELLYHCVLLAIWCFLVPGWPRPFLPAFHAVLLLGELPGLRQWRAALSRRLPVRIRTVLIMLSGFLVLSVAWNELAALHRLWPRITHDALVGSWDFALTGAHLSRSWSHAMPARWFSEIMFGGYLSYFLLAFLPLTVAGFARSESEAVEFRFRLLSTYLLLFLFYLAFPVLGPAGPSSGVMPAGFFAGIAHGFRANGDALGTAFPSSHVGGAVAMAIVVWRSWGRRWGMLWVTGSVLVALSTVYTGNHLVVDAAAGALVCGILQWEPGRRLKPVVSLDEALLSPAEAVLEGVS